MIRARRILMVTGGLTVAGAALGAVAATLAIAIGLAGMAAADRPSVGFDLFLVGAVDGAALGAILGPATAWLALRRVSLGRAFTSTTIGTISGAIVGLALGVSTLLSAVVGFALAATWLRLRTNGTVRATGLDVA